MRAPRHLLIPNANNPEVLARLLDLVGKGVRSTRSLAEGLGVESRTVGYYTQAGEWLGLLDGGEAASLTPLGLEFVYAGDQRPAVYARAVWANPVVAELFAASDDQLPTVASIMAVIQGIAPDMAASTQRRRASSIRSLIAPAIGTRRVRPPAEPQQMALPLGLPRVPPPAGRLPTVGRREYSPEAYRYLLASLLDHGEVRLSHVRGLLDRAGADRAPIGGYVDMAIARGDASRLPEGLVVTEACCRRAELVESVSSVMLSDPAYRTYLEDRKASVHDRARGVRADEVASRYRSWDKRLFGRPIEPETVDRDLEGTLLERPLSAFPLAVGSIEPGWPVDGPFLERWEEPGVRVACPPALARLQGGVAVVNRLLRSVRLQPDAAREPSLVEPVCRVHGGILHPGEVLPRAVPDTRTLRIRVLTCAPYMALAGALLLTHRRQPHRLVIHRAQGRWNVRWDEEQKGALLPLLDAFARTRGWIVCRRPAGGLPDAALMDALEALGIASRPGRQAVLSEKFFGQLQRAPEESELLSQLAPIAEAFELFLAEP